MSEPTVSTAISGGVVQGVVGAASVHIENLVFNNYGSEVTPVTGADDTISVCPYPGLSYFGPDEADVFFGREVTVERLAKAVRRKSFVSVIGASGCGKSSVVLAGLAPYLHHDGGWSFSYFRVGTELDHDPYVALARVLVPLYVDTTDATERLVNTRKLARLLKDGTLALLDVFSEMRSRNKGRRILLIADQFEEVFTAIDDETVRRKFIDALFEPFRIEAPEREPEICLVVTLRADFYGRALLYRPLADLLQDRVENLGPMTRDELGRAIQRPAARRGVSFEPGLAETLLDRIEQEPGALPLLQFALRELWKRQQRRTLVRQAYNEIGGVEGALAKRAEHIFGAEIDRRMVPDRVFQRLFSRLVALGDGHLDTRRVVPRSELGDTAWALAQRLAGQENRLVVTSAPQEGQETAELAHEALIDHWPRLAEWLARDRAFRMWLQDIRRAATRWADDPSDDGPLLRGGILVQAREWLAGRADDLSAHETAFIQTSIALKQAEDDREVAERERDIQIQKQLARSSAERARAEAEGRATIEARARQQSVARQLSASAVNKISSDYSAALLLAVEATTVDNTLDARATLFDVVRRHPQVATYLRPPSPGRFTGANVPQNPAVAFSPDGRIIAAIDQIGGSAVQLWNVSSKKLLPFILHGHTASITSLAFSPHGDVLATAASDGVCLWSIADGKQISRLEFADLGNDLMAETIAFDAASLRIAIGTNDRSDGLTFIRVWDVETQIPVATLPIEGRDNYRNVGFGVSRLVFTNGGTSLVAGIQPFQNFRVGRRLFIPQPGGDVIKPPPLPDDGFVAVIDITTGQFLQDPWEGGVVAISPNGNTIFTRNKDGEISLIYNESKQRHPLPVKAELGMGAFNSRGRSVSFASGAELQQLDFDTSYLSQATHPTADCHFTSVALSRCGAQALTLNSDDSVMLWTLREPRSMGQLIGEIPGGVGAPPTALVLGGDGKSVVLPKGGTRDLLTWTFGQPEPNIGCSFFGTGSKPGINILVADHSVSSSSVLALLDDGTIHRVDPWGADAASTIVGEDATALAAARKADIWALGHGTGHVGLFWPSAAAPPGLGRLQIDTPVMTLAIDEAGEHIAVCGSDGHVTVFEVATAGRINELKAAELEGSDRFSLHFSPDGNQLLGLGLGQAVLWEVKRGIIVGRYASADQVYGGAMVGAFSPTDAVFALASPFEPGIRLIRSDRLEPYAAPLTLYTGGQSAGGVHGLAFSADGELLVAAYTNGDLVVWDMSLARARQEACEVANRNLTPAEWTRYLPSEDYRSTCMKGTP